MWGFGGRHYWGRKRLGGERIEGVVVLFAWMSSEERHLRSYVRLYESLGWASLVCHSQFLNMFFPDKATPLAVEVINELVGELKIRACPVVLASFSGGPKAIMYRVLQILEGNCEVQLNHVDIRLVRDCISGFIYDSSPVDFTSDLGTQFVVHPSVLKMSQPPRFILWLANGIASGLDALFLSRFESQRAEYWQTLYSTISMRVPYLILCSENDDLAPYQTISNFAERLRDLGGDVKLVTWNGSPHVGHYHYYPVDYKAVVNELVGKAAAIYSQRSQQCEGRSMGGFEERDEMSEPIFPLRNTTASSASSRKSSQGLSPTPSDQMFLPSSVECYDGRNGGSMQDEGMVHLPNPSSINAHGVLGQILFDVCVPKNVEDWDIRQSDSYYRRPLANKRKHAPFNPIKCIRRSRL